MRAVRLLLVVAAATGLAFAQTATSTPASDPDSLNDQIKQMRELMAAQQKQLADQQRQIEELQHKVTASPQLVSETPSASMPRLVNAVYSPNTAMPQNMSDTADRNEYPLSFRIGAADFTPGGFADFTNIFRTVNTGNAGGTNFYAIPFSNTVSGHLTETRMTAANSRVSLKATERFGKNDVTGYFEMDLLGNDASNAFVTSNSHTMRQRLYFVDVRREKFEVLAGQSWSLLTPNRFGLSPMPSDIFNTQNADFNYQVGLTWTRAPQLRFVYHATDKWALGVALENPEQFGGQSINGQSETTYPTAFNAQLAGQIDQGNISTTPNLHPDVIVKAAYDTTVGGKRYHAEVGGLLTGYRITNLAGPNFTHHTKEGGGVTAAVNLELVRGFRFVSNAFYSNGGGRYIFGMGPGVVVLPTSAGTDVMLSLVHAGAGTAGFEYQATQHTMIYAYYGGAYFQRNYALDNTAGAPANHYVGFGGPNSSNSNNRSVQEPTVGWIQTFWKNPQYGALQLITQASYVTRAPWFVAAGAPKNAHLTMGWLSFRYVLP